MRMEAIMATDAVKRYMTSQAISNNHARTHFEDVEWRKEEKDRSNREHGTCVHVHGSDLV